MEDLTANFLELVRLAATDLAPDIERSLHEAVEREEPGSAARGAMETIIRNVEMARQDSTPICQDTGTPIFYIYYAGSWSTRKLRVQIQDAVIQATERSYLRPNSVNTVTGKNTGNNTGDEHYPAIHFEEIEGDTLIVDLMLKGGGCENMGAQYKLPENRLGAGRDLEGVRKVVLDAVFQAQGKGCSPGAIGVAIGGDRGSSYLASKETLFRELGDENTDPQLAELETRLMEDSNKLGIGPMGFGGKTTVLDVKVKGLHRLPASYFVSVSYMCWAYRRRRMTYQDGETSYS
jgi:fumarate hydratase class I